MLTLYYSPGACSMAPHIALEEGGEKYDVKRVNLAQGEQRTPAYLKIHPLGRVPALILDNGEPLTENTAILPYLGKRFGLWPKDPVAEAQALSKIGFYAATVHPANAHVSRPERYATDASHHANIQATGRTAYFGYLQQIDAGLAGREWIGDAYSVLDPYAFTFFTWGVRREYPMAELRHFAAHKDRMLRRPAVQRVLDDENIKI